MFVGRVMQEKGIDELFQTMQRLNKEGYKCMLDVVGDLKKIILKKSANMKEKAGCITLVTGRCKTIY